MSFTLRTHQYKVDKATGRAEMEKEVPYVRIKFGKEPPVYVQRGKVYYETGEELTELPEWFETEFAKVSPAMRDAVGWEKGRRAKAQAA